MTKIGCISDIHSNFSALEIVLQFLEGKIDILLCAGDFVGYGPQPLECLDLLLDYPLPHYYCLGNHDLGVRHEYCKATSSNNCNTDRKTLQAFTVRPAAEVMFRRNAQEITEGIILLKFLLSLVVNLPNVKWPKGQEPLLYFENYGGTFDMYCYGTWSVLCRFKDKITSLDPKILEFLLHKHEDLYKQIPRLNLPSMGIEKLKEKYAGKQVVNIIAFLEDYI